MLADELVHYIEDLVDEEGVKQDLSSHQVMQLIFFAEQFNIFNDQYWQLTHEGLKSAAANLAPGELLSCLTSLKEQDQLSDQTLKEGIAQVMKNISSMSPSEIAVLLMVLNSDRVDAFLDQSEKLREENLNLIEQQLIKIKDKITPDTFGKICYGISTNSDAEGTSMVSDMPKFLFEQAIEVSNWAIEGRLPMDDIAYIMRAFQGDNIDETSELLEQLESYAI